MIAPVEIVRTVGPNLVEMRCSRCSLFSKVDRARIKCPVCDKEVRKR